MIGEPSSTLTVRVAFALGLAVVASARPAAVAAAPAATRAPAGGVSGDAPTTPQESRPRMSLKAARGFFDDAWAVDPAGKRLAIIRTDRETFQGLEVLDLDAGGGGGGGGVGAGVGSKPVLQFDVAPPDRAVESLTFPPHGPGLLLASAQGTDSRVVELVDDAGKVTGRTAPVGSIGFAATPPSSAGAPIMITFQQRTGPKGQLITSITPLRLPGLKAAGKTRTYVVEPDGVLRSHRVIPIGFFDGYSKLLSQRPGAYDKRRDVRLPDAQTVIDLLSGKPLTEAAIDDVYGWARTTRLRREHHNRTAFIQFAGALGEATNGVRLNAAAGVELVDPAGRLSPLPLAVPFRLYDRTTLKDQEGPQAGEIHFGMHVDPVNPDAVARQKADLPFLDVYTAPVAHPEACRLRARVRLDSRPAVWSVAGNRLVVLRRFKSFARGGDQIDVYDLVP